MKGSVPQEKARRISRRKFIYLGLGVVPVACAADAFVLERKWVAVRRFDLSAGDPTHTMVHFTDTHYKGDKRYLRKVVKKINELSADFVCFTGDIVEDKDYLAGALDILAGISKPMFGVPGNHDYWSGASFPDIQKCFEATGGKWLVDENTTSPDDKIDIVGWAGETAGFMGQPQRSKTLLLTHYPVYASKLKKRKFDLILAGHSHGGQVRIPFIGAPVLPFNVDQYDRGLFETPAGKLYVNPGIGTWYLPVRFLCRPEITVIDF